VPEAADFIRRRHAGRDCGWAGARRGAVYVAVKALVPRTQCGTINAFTRVFDALW
jgi:hypothetical protein